MNDDFDSRMAVWDKIYEIIRAHNACVKHLQRQIDELKAELEAMREAQAKAQASQTQTA